MSGRLHDGDGAGHARDGLAVVIDGVGDRARLGRDLLLALAGVAERTAADRAARRAVASAYHRVGEVPGLAHRAVEDVGAAESAVVPVAELGTRLARRDVERRSAVVGDRAGVADPGRVAGRAEVARGAGPSRGRAAVGVLGGGRARVTDLGRVTVGARQRSGIIAVWRYLAVGAGGGGRTRVMPVDPAVGAGRALEA